MFANSIYLRHLINQTSNSTSCHHHHRHSCGFVLYFGRKETHQNARQVFVFQQSLILYIRHFFCFVNYKFNFSLGICSVSYFHFVLHEWLCFVLGAYCLNLVAIFCCYLMKQRKIALEESTLVILLRFENNFLAKQTKCRGCVMHI